MKTNNLLFGLITLTLMIMLISSVSATEFDNILSPISFDKSSITIGDELKSIDYTPIWDKYAPQKVRNWFGLLPLVDMALYQHDDTCGLYCHSTFDICSYDEISLIDDVKFLKKDGENWVEKSIEGYNFLIGERKEVDAYEFICSKTGKTLVNGTAETICEDKIIGKRMITEWKEYKLGEVKKAGCYEIRIDGKKNRAETIDWQIKTQGKWIEAWSTWGAVGSGNSQVDLTLPTDNSALVTNVNFTGNATVVGGDTLSNISLYLDSTGTWKLNDTVTFGAGGFVNLEYWAKGTAAGNCGTSRKVGGINITVTKNKYLTGAGVNTGVTGGTFLLQNADRTTNLTTGTVNADKTITLSTPYLLEVGKSYNLMISNEGAACYAITAGGASSYKNMSVTGCWRVLGDSYEHDCPNGWSNFWNVTTEEQIAGSTFGTASFNLTFTNLINDIKWGFRACDSSNVCGFSVNRTLLGTATLTATISSPDNHFNTTSNTLTLKCNFTSSGQNISSVMLNVTNSSGQQYTNTTLGSLFSHNQTWITPALSDGSYNWTCKGFGDKGINATSLNRTFRIDATLPVINLVNPTGDYYSINQTINYTSSEILQYIRYSINGKANITITGNTSILLELGNNTITLYANDTVGNNAVPSTKYAYLHPTLVYCNSSTNITNGWGTFLNFTFKDEITDININAEIPTSIFNYWSTNESAELNRTLSFINNTNNPSYSFCGYPIYANTTLDISLQYKNVTSYPQRTYNPAPFSQGNSTLNKVLYLLNSASGLYVTFQVINGAEEALAGVEVNGTRVIGSETVMVAQGTTDASGAVTFWLNPDFSHIFTFVKSGYPIYVTSITPTQSTYTINLGNAASSTVPDYSRSVTQSIKPTDSFLNKNSIYSFNYTISSTYWNLDSWGFTLRYYNGSIISTQTSLLATGGTLNVNINTTNTSKMIMEYYYVANSTNVNGTRYWIIQSTDGTSYSIKNLFERIDTYVSLNILGINGDDGNDTFGRALISVLIIILVTGGLTYRYGIQSEAAILGTLFGVVLFLNSVNFIPSPDFLTETGVNLGTLIAYLLAILTIGFIIKEEYA